MKNVFALAGMLVASLLTSTALGGKTDPSDKYENSQYGTVTSGVIKSLRNCPDGTEAFFKNVNPFISGGPGGNPGETQWDGTFLIDGTPVTLSVWWKDDNSFRFKGFGVVVTAIGAEVDSDKLIYKYGSPPEYDSPVFEDSGLNVLEVGGDAAAVNHLDLCLSLVDATPPVIEFISPLDGTSVSGTVTVIVTATDPSGVDPNSVTVSVYQDDVLIADLGTGQLQQDGSYTWDWPTAPTAPTGEYPNAEDLPAGLYEIVVSATDAAEPQSNTATASVTVELRKWLANCFGILGDEDFTGELDPDGYANGCEPTVLANVQVPPDTDVCNPELAPDPDNIPEFCNISGEQLKPDPGEYAIAAWNYGFEGRCDACALNYCGDIAAGEYGIPDPRMYCPGTFDFDPESGEGGCDVDWIPVEPLVPLLVKDVAAPTADGPETELVLGKYVYGHNGCFAASQHFRGGTLLELYPAWPEDDPQTDLIDEATGLVFIKTHRPANVIPDAPIDLIAKCSNIGLLDVAQAGYQPIGKTQSVDRLADGTPAITFAATQECFNPPRTLSRDNGIDVSNIIETDGSDDALAFKYQMAQMRFDALFVALDCAEPTFLRRGKSRFSNVSSPINQAKAQFDNGTIAALERARDDLLVAADAIRTSNWDVTPENCAGDALARTENLAWRMTDLIAAPRP